MASTTEPAYGITNPNANPEVLVSAILVIGPIILVLTFLHLSLRLYATLRITRSAGFDDYTCVIAFILLVLYTGLVVGTRHYARHEWNLGPETHAATFSKIALTGTIFGSLALFSSKLSILLLLFRLFSPNQRTRYLIYFGTFFAAIVAIASIAVDGALCTPHLAQSFNKFKVVSRCGYQGVWGVVQSTAIVVLNLYIFYLPIPMICRLKLSLKRKLGILGIFMTSLM